MLGVMNATSVMHAGHSKGGDDVILYACQHDGDIPLIVNISGRYWLDRGMTDRFGKDFMQKLEAGRMKMKGQYQSSGAKFEWELTKEVN